jgi:homoserine dehydrogenase
MRTISIGFLGLGTVGQGVWEQLIQKSSVWKQHLGVEIAPVIAAVRDIRKKRDITIAAEQLTTDTDSVVTNPDIDLVIELIGGTDEARRLTLLAFENGKSVISANKALIALHGKELLEAANKAGVQYLYEASVAGGIPIIKVIREAFVGNHIQSLQGILNGTSNYILTRMERDRISYQDALKEAKTLGYVEQDESLDLDGIDAAQKLLILAYLCFHQWFPIGKIHVEGIRNISLKDIKAADRQGFKIKLIATLRELADFDRIECSVRPCMVPLSNNLASVNEVFNGVCIQGDIVGISFLVGRGAGREPPSSAVLSDVVDFCRNDTKRKLLSSDNRYKLSTPDQLQQSYYVRIEVDDVKGVMSDITQILSNNNISISTIDQVLNENEASASIMLTTHKCSDESIQKTCRTVSERSYLRSGLVIFPILEN